MLEPWILFYTAHKKAKKENSELWSFYYLIKGSMLIFSSSVFLLYCNLNGRHSVGLCVRDVEQPNGWYLH